MALAKPSDSDTSLLSPGDNKDGVSSDEIVAGAKDTFTNKTAISSIKYRDVFNTLLAQVDGSRVVVEYFKKEIPFSNNQLGATSFSMERNSIHGTYDQVHNFEIVLRDEISVDVDGETGELSADGEAFIYPGFKPNPGDMFYLKLLDNQIGVFMVNDVNKLSISRDSYYTASFSIYLYLTPEFEARLDAAVRDELWFEKDKFFTGTVSLLTDASYQQLNVLKDVRGKILNNYKMRFYNKEAQTFIRPDDTYDPNIVEFLFNRISVNDLNLFQLGSSFIDKYPYSIWNALIHNDVSQFELFNYVPCQPIDYIWDVYTTMLASFSMVFLKKEDDEIYDSRMTPLKFDENDLAIRPANYFFSNLLYYAIINSFETNTPCEDITPLIPNIDTDERFFAALSDTIYCVKDEAYIDLIDLQAMNVEGGSNNNIHLSELEYLVFDLLINDSIDVQSLVDNILPKFPFTNMTDDDRFYYFPMLMHVIDIAIARLN